MYLAASENGGHLIHRADFTVPAIHFSGIRGFWSLAKCVKYEM